MQKRFNIRTLSWYYLAVRSTNPYEIPSFRKLPTQGCLTRETEEEALDFYKKLLLVIVAMRGTDQQEDIIYDIENIPFEVYSFYRPS